MSGPLSSLSVELVQEIAVYLDTHDQTAVRATCSALSASLVPLLFSVLTLNIRNESLERDLSRLRAVADGRTPYSHYARDLYIKQLTPYFWNPEKDPKIAEEETRCLIELEVALKLALGRLDGVQAVRWVGSSLDRDWVPEIVLDALARWDIREFTYEPGQRKMLPAFDRLSGASLTRLSVPVRPTADLKPLLILLQRSPNLASLSLSASTDPSHLHDIWSCLQSQPIHLVELSVNSVSPQLCEYLTSYTGLRRLVLRDVDTSRASRDMADTFFERVLPHHSASLIELRLASGYTGNWSFGTHNITVLSSLAHLQTLELALDTARKGGAAQTRKDFALLLGMLPHLPTLRSLTIRTTQDDWFRDELVCGHGMVGYWREKDDRLRSVLEGYVYPAGTILSAELEVKMPFLRDGRCLRLVEADDGNGLVYAQFEGGGRLSREECVVDSDEDD
ncbi:hypothetical protein HMN09_01109100 [Mycena chlorophos]|uniref:F-box domain-containing protein n=1 Tax=Mycena chlorophos TaxID=658473 RepID=A0A8H6SBK6_MYCCL|nr:hypothetical protein HMN09_01109100 [Mycena chlorophos]